MNYTFTFGRNSQLVWIIIFPAFVWLIPLIVGMEVTLKYFPEKDWIFVVLTLTYTFLVISSILKGVKAVRTDVEITFSNTKLQFIFPVKNIFHKKDFELEVSDILNTSEDNDKGFDFLNFETQNTSYPKFHLMTKEDNPEFIEFKNKLYNSIKDFNVSLPEEVKIKHISIYQKWPMKLLAVIFLACWFIFPFLINDNESNWLVSTKYWVFVIVSSPIIFKVYIQNFKN